VNMNKKLLLLLPLLLLGGCRSLGINTAENYLKLYQEYPPEVRRFQVCHDMGCEQLASVTMGAQRWNELSNLFQKAAASPQAERRQVAQAIARFETLVGPLAGTSNDEARNYGAGHADQELDCISETVNTTTYLLLFQKQGWLRWHTVGEPRHRGFFNMKMPHNTAVLMEKRSGKEYVIDSWFHANGELPEVVTVEKWMAGYDPDDQPNLRR